MKRPRGTGVPPVNRQGQRGLRALITTLLLLSAATASAADPQLSRIDPVGGQRGNEAVFTLHGQRLSDAAEVVFYEPGITAKSIEPDGERRVKVTWAIAPDCRLGNHAVRLRTKSGISNLITFSVGALPAVDEAEPNNEFDAPQKIPLNTTVHGVVQNEDVDYFLVEAKKGQRIAAEIEGIRLGRTFFDPYLAILDEGRFVLAGSDDTPLVWQDAACSTVAPADGTYVIQVRESAFGGSGACQYRLHVGTFPRPLAAYPAGGKLGQKLQVQWIGDAAGDWSEEVALPTGPREPFGLVARDDGGAAPSANRFRLSELPNVLEKEPNDKPEEATTFSAPAALNGAISKPGDLDQFKFSAKKGQSYEVRVHARELRSPLDSVLAIRRIGGAGVGSNDDSGGPDSYLRFQAPADDEYVVSIRDHLDQGAPHYVYRVELTPMEPQLTMSLPERSSFVDVTAPVPRGNRVAVMVGAQREGFGGEVNVELRGLPQGVKATAVPMADDRNAVPVLLEAAADAPMAGALVEIVGRHTKDDRTIEGRLRQRTSLVRGQNNREVRNHYTRRMAAAVTEKAPYRLKIVQPKVPLVRNGNMNLKVVAERDEGFTAPIVLTMLYAPPGVSAPVSVTMPESKSEAIIPLTAAGNASTRVWDIAILGEATVGGGKVLVSTQLAKLEVAEPFVGLSFPIVAVEQGKTVELGIEVEQRTPFEGPADVELLGLPAEVTAPPQKLKADAEQLVFPISTTEKSPPGHHKSLICKVVITQSGEPITHLLGRGELRIQKPLPEKPKEEKKAEPEPRKEPKKKQLSRLEQLRLEREKALKGEN
jgi:hypothetical protein